MEGAPIAARTHPECGAEFRVHVRLIAVTEFGGEHGQRVLLEPQSQAKAGQAPQALKGAERRARLGTERLRNVDRMTTRDLGQLEEEWLALQEQLEAAA